MSLRGRHIIDRIKRSVSHRLKLPSPPYGKPGYWDGVYEKLGPNDTYEWGDFTISQDLLSHQYDSALYQGDVTKYGFRSSPSLVESELAEDNHPLVTTTFGEAIGIPPNLDDNNDNTTTTQPKKIMLLGCGNSRMGEELLLNGYHNPSHYKIYQVDVSNQVITTMKQRHEYFISTSSTTPYLTSDESIMEFINDDATSLQSFESNSIDSIIDKGLVDALFCADEYEMIHDVLSSVHRVLKTNDNGETDAGVFNVFSYSRPEFLMGRTFDASSSLDGTTSGGVMVNKKNKEMWQELQIRALDHILMYRFVKASSSSLKSDKEEINLKGKKWKHLPQRGKKRRVSVSKRK
uniref:Methyltransferase type 11 domain-containing protein n=1 Tax=Ditylum brightwellii TaxID=49249 RepID=A0A7S4VXB4_9STRA